MNNHLLAGSRYFLATNLKGNEAGLPIFTVWSRLGQSGWSVVSILRT